MKSHEQIGFGIQENRERRVCWEYKVDQLGQCQLVRTLHLRRSNLALRLPQVWNTR